MNTFSNGVRNGLGSVSHRTQPKIDFEIRAMVTNESLEAVCAALSPEPSDRILAIAGIGCVPFALAESNARVFGIDRDPRVIETARNLASLIEKNDWEAFLNVGIPGLETETQLRNVYFEPGRRASIQEGAKQIGFKVGDICEALGAESRAFSKVYLSNVLGFGNQCGREYLSRFMQALNTGLADGALVYSSSPLLDRAVAVYENGTSKEYTLDVDRTGVAQQCELARVTSYGWQPRVYRFETRRGLRSLY